MEQAREWIQSAMLSVTYSPCWRGNPPDDSFVSPALFLLLANKVDLLGSKDHMSQTTVDAEKALRLAESYGADFAGRIFFTKKYLELAFPSGQKKATLPCCNLC